MLTEAEAITEVDHFRGEVSGWDENQIFFVEKSCLAWDEFAGKHVSLRHMLPEGAIVFVRTLHSTALTQPAPIAYKVEFIGCDSGGLHQFRLTPVQPRYIPEIPTVN